jgi:predicted O-methyltransferase YrrM
MDLTMINKIQELEYVNSCILMDNIPQGFLSPADVMFLEKIVKLVKNSVLPAVELGCWRGRSSVIIARQVDLLYSIDNWENNSKNFFKKNIRKFGVENKILTISGNTQDIIKTWDEKIKFLFIDASHDYENVRKDLEWSWFLECGGIVALHDYNIISKKYIYGVDKAQKEFFAKHNKEFEFLDKSENIIAYRKSID